LSAVKQDGAEGFGHDVDVEEDAAVFDVVEVVLEFDEAVFDGFAIGVVDLCPAGESGFDDVAGFVIGHAVGDFLDEYGALGTGSDDGHLAFEDVYELGEFVDAGFAEELPEIGDAAVVDDGKNSTGGFGIANHGAQF